MKVIAKTKTATPKHTKVARKVSKKIPAKKKSGRKATRKKHGVMQNQPTWKPFMA